MSSDWHARARAILNREWDPIRVLRHGAPPDEYDTYRDQLAALIEAGIADDGLLTYLEWAEVAFMGLGGLVDRERNVRVVASLRTLGPPPPCAVAGPEGWQP